MMDVWCWIFELFVRPKCAQECYCDIHYLTVLERELTLSGDFSEDERTHLFGTR